MTCHVHVENLLSQIAIFSQCLSIFKCNPEQVASLLPPNNFYPVISCTDEFERKRKRRITVYGSVTRYGPRVPAPGVKVYISKVHAIPITISSVV